MALTYSLRGITDLEAGDHLCSLYETEEEHRALLTPFLRQGLERGEKVLYIVDAHTAEALLGYLRDDGLVVEPYLASGQLSILTASDAYMRERVFDPDGMVTLLRTETERALAEGYSALRLTGEMSWALRGLPGSERLIEYEARLNEFFPGSKCLAVCQYDRRRFDPAVLLDVLCTHPIIAVGTAVYHNFYYIPPAEFLDHDPSAAKLRHWLDSLAERKRAEEEIRHRAAHQEALNAIAAAVSQSLDLKEILDAALEETLAVLEIDVGGIYLLEPDGEAMTLQVHRGAREEFVATVRRLRLGEGISGQAVAEGKPVILDALDYPTERLAPFIVKEGFQTLASVPLISKGKALGALTLDTRRPRAFPPQELELLVAIGHQIGVAIENARLHQEAQHRVEELIFLNQIGRTVTSSLDLEQILTTLMHETTEVLKVEAASVMLLDDQGKELVFETAAGLQAQEIEGLRLPLAQGIAGWVARQGQPVLVPDAREDPRFYSGIDQATGFVTRSVLAIPLEVKEKVIGVIEAVNKTEGDFSQADVALLSSMAQSAAIAIENAQLYKDLQDRMEELKRTQAQLIQSAKLAAIGELAAGVAHELNNPLTSIVGFTSLLSQEVNDDDPMKEDLQIIEQEAARTKTIVRGLLDFARQTESRLELADVNEIVQSTMALLRNQAKVARVIVKESYDENLPLVLLDAGQIKQVFLNIMTNAIQAMPQGGELEVVTNYQPQTIDSVDCVAVEFHDTGTGIPAENLPRIFDPFFTTKKASQGTGLGLSISHGIVEKHGGKIKVESEVGRGSTFTVLLPVAERQR